MPSRAAFLIYDLGCGGAERVVTRLANGLQARGHDISVITLSGPEEPFYPLSGAVRRVPLGVPLRARSLRETLGKNLVRVRAIRRALHALAPDVLIGFMTENNVLAVLASRVFERLPCRVVVSERVHPSRTNLRKIACAARVLTFPLADAVVTCSRGMVPWYTAWLPAHKVAPIQNPVVLDDRGSDLRAEEAAARMAGDAWVLGMGRLDPQKGFDLLLEAFARVDPQARAGWRLGIIGEGDEREALERLIAALGLRECAFLLGRFRNPYPLLRAGRVFALSSRYEGFPNALTEAMACGCACVAFDCPTGPAEIIRDGVDGLLVPPGDVGGLSQALARLMADGELRSRLAERAPEVIERFNEGRFLDRWEALIRGS